MSNPLKITVLAHALHAGGGVSVGKNLIGSLMRSMPDSQFQVSIPDGFDYEHSAPANTACQWIRYDASSSRLQRYVFDRIELRRQLNHFQPDVIIGLGNRGSDIRSPLQIVLVQDAHLFYPQSHFEHETRLLKLMQRYKRFRLAKDLKRTDVLLCQTQTAKSRISNSYNFSGQIIVLPNAVSSSVINDGPAVRHGYPEGVRHDGFRLFYLTRYYPHKNLELLLDLFSTHDPSLEDVVLYITISPNHHPGARRFLEAVSARGLQRQIVNLGPLTQERIGAYYRCMHALVMPTTLESFSGTYLEAMTFGCPILTSDIDFAREICQDAAIFFDPWSVESIKDTIMRLKNDPFLARRLIDNGRQVLSRSEHSWDHNGKSLARIIMGNIGDNPEVSQIHPAKNPSNKSSKPIYIRPN